jgi:hypothetical protein
MLQVILLPVCVPIVHLVVVVGALTLIIGLISKMAEVSVAAALLGSEILNKHATDRTSLGTDHE